MKKSSLVVYQNNMNTVALKDFTSQEIDLFFTICSQMREKGVNKLTFSFEHLKNISDYNSRSIERFAGELERVYKKMTQLTFREKGINQENEETIKYFVLFNSFEINKTKKEVTIKTNEEFDYILNCITNEFTKFELEEFISMKSNYTKNIYRLLKQYKKTGYFIIEIDEFKRILDIPLNYKMCDIDTWVLKPIKKELVKYFKEFKINKIKAIKGNKIDKMEFIFSPEHDFLFDNLDDEKITFKSDAGDFYIKEKKNVKMETDEFNKVYGKYIFPLSQEIERSKIKKEKETFKQQSLFNE